MYVIKKWHLIPLQSLVYPSRPVPSDYHQNIHNFEMTINGSLLFCFCLLAELAGLVPLLWLSILMIFIMLCDINYIYKYELKPADEIQ